MLIFQIIGVRYPVIESALGEIHCMCVWLSMNRCESEAGDNKIVKQNILTRKYLKRN